MEDGVAYYDSRCNKQVVPDCTAKRLVGEAEAGNDKRYSLQDTCTDSYSPVIPRRALDRS